MCHSTSLAANTQYFSAMQFSGFLYRFYLRSNKWQRSCN